MATDTSPTDLDLDQVIASNVSATVESFPWDVRIRRRGDFEIWLEGDVVACACPDCGSPMSVRLWLKLADCWSCGTGIELSEQVVEQAERLLAEAQQQESAKTAGVAAPGARQPVSQPLGKVAAPPPAPRQPPPQPVRRVSAASQPAALKRKRKEQEVAPLTLWTRQTFRDLPAWIASLVLHLAALLLLAVWLLPSESSPEPFITLSTQLDDPTKEGEVNVRLSSEDYDANDRDEDLKRQMREQDAKKLQIERDANLPLAAPISAVMSNIKSQDPAKRMLAARDPRVRADVVKKEGGTSSTEAAVSRGLDWLARNQRPNGSWSLQAHGGRMQTDPGATSLALLPFLGAGQTHLVGIYQDNVDKGLGYLISIQKENGDLRGNSQANAGMYAHGQAAIVLAEAYKLTGDEKLKIPAQKAIDFIVAAQHPAGGWRYNPGEAGDLSVVGWQIMALYSAQSANLEVPESTIKLAGYFLDSVARGDHGGLYEYMPKKGPTPTMTAEGLLCRMYLGWNLKNPGLVEGVDYLNQHLPGGSENSIYYIYYATQAMHHVGGADWEAWNLKMRDNLVSSQVADGKEAGSWAPRSNHDQSGGRLYATALSTATLEVYYRHAPLFRPIKLN
ncbi:MAG: prenyltransferase/squalene oxidase repeat-containing protein [Pirellulales bacterium]